MKVMVLTNSEFEWTSATVLVDLARFSTSHQLTSDVDDADLAIFPDPHITPSWSSGQRFRRDAVAQELMRRRVLFVYDERDLPRPDLPGVYTSLRRSAPRWTRATAYLRNDLHLQPQPLVTAELLFGFIGGPSHVVRRRVAALTSPRGSVVLLDAAQPRPQTDDHFLEALAGAKFALCPRGHGPSSYRIFEAMAAARVPVIISDDWIPPSGPEWQEFSIRVPEREVDRIPELLGAAEPRFEVMARQARAAFEEHFAREVVFDRMIEQLVGLSHRVPSSVRTIQSVRYDVRHYVRGAKGALRQVGRNATRTR